MWKPCSPCTGLCRNSSGCSPPRGRERRDACLLDLVSLDRLLLQYLGCLLDSLGVFCDDYMFVRISLRHRFGVRFLWAPFWLFFFLNKRGRAWTQISGKYFFFESYIWHFIGGLLASSSKQSVCNWKTGVSSCVRKISWRRQWQPTPVFLLEEFHGQRSLVGFQIVGSQRVRCDSAANTHTSGFLQGSKTDLKAMAFLSVGSGNCQWGEEPQNHLCQPYSGRLDPCPPLPHNHGQKCGELKAGARSSMGHADTGRDNWSLMGTLLPKDCCGSEAAFETPTPLCWMERGPTDPPDIDSSRARHGHSGLRRHRVKLEDTDSEDSSLEKALKSW